MTLTVQSPMPRTSDDVEVHEVPPTATRSGALRRRLTTLLLAPVLALAALGLTAAPSDAVVGPYAPYAYQWGACKIVLGTVVRSNRAAMAGTDVTCSNVRRVITIKVNLYRWNGYSWDLARTSGWQTGYNTSAMSAWTGDYCGGGNTNWDETTTVNVDGSQIFLDRGVQMGTPGHPYVPTWNPTC